MRKYWMVAGAIIVALVIVGQVTRASVGAERRGSPPERERCIFVTYPVKPSLGPPQPTDQEDDYRVLQGGIHLPVVPVSYSVDTSGAPAGAFDAVVASFEEWDSATSEEVFADPDPGSVNTVSWGTLEFPGAVAVTYVWYIPRTKEVSEFHIVFSSDEDWSTSGEVDMFDVQNVATHEVGHTLALDDLRAPKDGELTMYAFVSLEETKKRDLGVGDILGIQAIYGE